MSENLVDYCLKMLTDRQTTDARLIAIALTPFGRGVIKLINFFSEEGLESKICMLGNLVDYCSNDDRVK